MSDTLHEIGDGTYSLHLDPALLQALFGSQPPLFVVVHRDDAELLASSEGDWLRALLELQWRSLRGVGARYYQALYESNIKAAAGRPTSGNAESEDDATQRLITERPTGGNSAAPVLHPLPVPPEPLPCVARAEDLEPGVVPARLAGRAPKCFFALLKAFIGVQLMGKAANADEVYHHLMLSPPFARACGFTLPDPTAGYRQSDIPALRKLEQFEQIMADNGLWSQIRIQAITENLQQGVVSIEDEDLVLDTTHYFAYSQMNVHTVAPAAESTQAPQPRPEPSPTTPPKATPRRLRKAVRRAQLRAQKRAHHVARKESNRTWSERREAKRQAREASEARRATRPSEPKADAGQSVNQAKPAVQRKSQSRTVKNCRCRDRQTCPHQWVQADAGAGTVVKGTCTGKKKYWAHKAAVLSTTSGIPLDARAMTDAATHDGEPVLEHLGEFFDTYPELVGVFSNLLADSAFDDDATKQKVEDRYGLAVKTPVNPRRIKTRTEDLGRGMKSLSPTGTLTCQADREMTYLGVRFSTERFLYGPPRVESGQAACLACPLKNTCCRSDNADGRRVEIPFTQLSHINPADPQMAKRFKVIMRRRTSVERAIKRIKLDFGDDHLARRGNNAFQGHLDRSLIALHWLLRLDL